MTCILCGSEDIVRYRDLKSTTECRECGFKAPKDVWDEAEAASFVDIPIFGRFFADISDETRFEWIRVGKDKALGMTYEPSLVLEPMKPEVSVYAV